MSSASSFRPGSDPLGTLFETVSALTERIKATLEADFPDVALHGEITNLARPKSGHIYFSLRDQAASIRAVMWKGDAQRLASICPMAWPWRRAGAVDGLCPAGRLPGRRPLSRTGRVALSSWPFVSSTPGSRPRACSIPTASVRCPAIPGES